MGVAMKIVMITGMVSMGIGQGVQPLLGYSFGAGNRDRFKKYMKFSLLFATGLGIALTVLCYAFVHSIVAAKEMELSQRAGAAVSRPDICFCSDPAGRL
ncbi:MAG: MATE family efflux transporter [Eubacteriales bacterium]|nr:MATE family efflux transporter [Eubacteriales bacterium]